MSSTFRVVSPASGDVLLERPWATPAAADRALTVATRAFSSWRRTPLAQRQAAVRAWLDRIEASADGLARQISEQMGRPASQTPGEIRGFLHRGRTMVALADEALADLVPPAQPGRTRLVRQVPRGVVLVLAPWNYPWLTAVNTIAPALVAGNTVVLKHSDQTPLVAEAMTAAWYAAGLPEGVLAHLHASHELVGSMVADPRVAMVAFTGSVGGGKAVHTAAAGTFKTVGLELGGHDAGYVRADADLDAAIAGLADGAFFNAGQSCCGIERIYVDRSVYDRFVDGVVAQAEALVLADPADPTATLGPVVRARAAEDLRARLAEATAAGARACVDPSRFDRAGSGAYVAPQVLTGVPGHVSLAQDEIFGPMVCVWPVDGDDEAIARINDDAYGLTASLWTADLDAASDLGSRLDVGTVYANRCDALDPELAWVGVKDSGNGTTLSRFGYGPLTRPQSFLLEHPKES